MKKSKQATRLELRVIWIFALLLCYPSYGQGLNGHKENNDSLVKVINNLLDDYLRETHNNVFYSWMKKEYYEGLKDEGDEIILERDWGENRERAMIGKYYLVKKRRIKSEATLRGFIEWLDSKYPKPQYELLLGENSK